MKKSDFGVVAVVYAIIFGFLYMTLDLVEEAQTYPLSLLAALFFLNTLYLVLAVRKYLKERVIHDDLPKIFNGFLPVQFFTTLAGAAGYIVLMEMVGYYIASVVYMAASLLFLQVRKSWIMICIAVLLATIYLVFSLFLNVPLPAGIMFE